MLNDRLKTLLLLASLTLPACGPNAADVDPFDADGELGQDEDALTGVSDDDLNGLYVATVGAEVLAEEAMVYSWPESGIRLTLKGATVPLKRSGDALTGAGVALTVKPNAAGVGDDSIEGTVNGAAVVLRRDTRPKEPVTLALPKDRPFRSFLDEVIAPAAQRDRESYTTLRSAPMGTWLRDVQLYRSGAWLRKYFKGANRSEQSSAFHDVVSAVNNLRTTPRRMTKEFRFSNALKANLSDPELTGLAMSTFSMYFPTAAGRALRIRLTDDAMAYFITDRPQRAERLGLVVMDTPTHHPLASTFGRQLLDLGEMPAADTVTYARVLMELLARSDASGASQLSPVGRSALIDWYAVMAIEDYRGVAFGMANLGWGYNMSNVQFYGLVARSLARPGAVDSAGAPVKGQVIVGAQLRPGEPSYADVLNDGGDMQEYGDMARLKTLATAYLRERHPQRVAEVEASFAGVVPANELGSLARNDVFHFICAQLYDARGRTAALKDPAKAVRAVNAVVALFQTLETDSAPFEAWLLTKGLTQSDVPAPKSTGF